MDQTERAHWVALHEVDGLGPQRLPILIKHFGSAKKAWGASRKELTDIHVPENIIAKLEQVRRRLDPVVHLTTLARLGVTVVTVEDTEYPQRLKEISGRPNLLYVKGAFVVGDDRAIAVVGTRKPTDYGRDITEKLVAGLVGHGFTIVSGLARGIDSIAHRAALSLGGRTIAVMGTGVTQVYPPENKDLADKIRAHGALVSEFAPGYVAVPGNFPARNRIISGLSLGVLVTEGASKSGTKITASHAADQGREVFAVPGPITSVMSEGPADLMKLGAKVVTSVEDIIDELKIGPSTPLRASKSQTLEFETEVEKRVYGALSDGHKHVDELTRVLKLQASEIGAALTQMELKGWVKHLGGGTYTRN